MFLLPKTTFADNSMKCLCNLKKMDHLHKCWTFYFCWLDGGGGWGVFEVCLNPWNKMVWKRTIIHNAWCISLTHIQGFLSYVLLEAHKKSLNNVKTQFSCVCSGLGHAVLAMSVTPDWFDFLTDMKAIISSGIFFQFFSSSIYQIQSGFKS